MFGSSFGRESYNQRSTTMNIATRQFSKRQKAIYKIFFLNTIFLHFIHILVNVFYSHRSYIPNPLNDITFPSNNEVKPLTEYTRAFKQKVPSRNHSHIFSHHSIGGLSQVNFLCFLFRSILLKFQLLMSILF